MKKIGFILVAAFALVFTACEKEEETPVYRAEASEFSHGWKAFLEAEIENDEVVSVDFDYVDEDGNLKSETTEENYPMDPHPTVWIPEYEAMLLGTNVTDFTDTDVVTGATGAWSAANQLLVAVIGAYAEGDTETQVVVLEEKTPVYRAEASDFSHGWKAFLEAEIGDGEVVSVDFDYVDEDGNLKSETTEENYPMDPHPTVWIPEYEAMLLGVDVTNFTEVDVISGATGAWGAANSLMAAVIGAYADGDTDTQVVVLE